MAKMFDSCFVPFKLHYAETKYLDIGDPVYSETVSAGGHLWRMRCHPNGDDEDDSANNDEDGEADDYLAIFLELMSNSRDVKAVFEAFFMEKNGEPSSCNTGRIMEVFAFKNESWGWPRLVKRRDLESLYVVDGWVTIVWGVMVMRDDDPLIVPSSDIGSHLGQILDWPADGNSDVSFVIGSQTFLAHWAVLATRSPVFKAELFGSMAEASLSHITLEDITPATFEVFLLFMYTDALPEDDDCTIEMCKHLLVVADRYAMDRLKLMCAKKLWDDVSVDTVAETLSYAETYSCAELKTKCIAFFVEEKNFREAVLTDGFVALVQNFPGFIAELRKKSTSSKKGRNRWICLS